MKKRRRFLHGMQGSILLSFSALLLAVVMVLSMFSLRYAREQSQQTALEYTEQLIGQINAEISQYASFIRDISTLISTNSAVLQYLQADQMGMADKRDMLETSNILHGIQTVRTEISSILIAPEHGEVLFGKPGSTLNPYCDYKLEDWYQGARGNDGREYNAGCRVENIVMGEYEWVVSVSKEIQDQEGNCLGVLLVNLNYDVIDEICAKVQLGHKGYIFILDNNGNIMWHPDLRLINAGIKTEMSQEIWEKGIGNHWLRTEDGDRLYIARLTGPNGWRTIGVANPDEMLRDQQVLTKQIVLISVIAILLAVVVAFLLSETISRPVQELSKTIQVVESGDYSVRSQVHSRNEVGQLSDSFNHMVAHTEALMEQQRRDEELKRKAEWELLQAQIKPHFIYNTLDSIIWMSQAGDNEEVIEMTQSLASLLRNSVGNAKEIITLEEELEHVQSYLTIQKIRYRDLLQYELDIEEKTRSCLLPKLVLQPLVENAIYHGLKPKEGGGTIRITSMIDEDQLLLTVEDDGVGMDEEKAQSILTDCQTGETCHIGVGNVNQRLKLYFGPTCSLKFFSEPNKGTMVMLVIPKREEGEPIEAV